jgi:hypothetical protein
MENISKDLLFNYNFTPEFVYILGLLWADGYVDKKSNRVSIECVKDDIDYFFPIFKTTGNFNLTERQRPNRRIQGTISKSSLELSTFLKENDYDSKSLLSPNKILNKIPKNLIHYFYLGWSDGDGCFYYSKTKKIIQFIISGSYDQDWGSLITICNELKIQYRIDRFITKKNHKYSRFLINKNEDILIFGKFIYENTLIGLPRKKEKYNVIKNYIDDKNSIVFECYDKSKKLINEFSSLKSASDWLNKGRYVGGSINDSIVGRQPTAYGYFWKKSKKL